MNGYKNHIFVKKTKSQKTYFYATLAPFLIKREMNRRELAEQLNMAYSYLYRACVFKGGYPLSKFMINCIADTLELSITARKSLQHAAKKDRELWKALKMMERGQLDGVKNN